MDRAPAIGHLLKEIVHIRSFHDLHPFGVKDTKQRTLIASRYCLMIGIVWSIIAGSIEPAVYGMAMCVFLVMVLVMSASDDKRESFIDPNQYHSTPGLFVTPTSTNPAMNVLPTTYLENPTRGPAAPAYDPEVSTEMERFAAGIPAAEGISPFFDKGDDISLRSSMRTWYATANTQIPNAQDDLARWCYGDMPSCKEGSAIACTKGMPPNWTAG